jgi:hypothetical protein
MALTYREAIAEALRKASAALDDGDTGAVRTWAGWASWYADAAYAASPSKRDADLAATLDSPSARTAFSDAYEGS